MTIPAVLIASVEAAINRYLSLDPSVFERLEAMEGKVIAIHIQGINQRLYLFPGGDGMMVLADYDGEADTEISGSPFALARLGMAPNPADVLFSGDVQIMGDTRLGTQFKKILAGIAIDWEELAAQFMGDIAAHKVGNVFRGVQRWMRRSASHGAEDMGDYIKEEAGLSPSASEQDAFMRGVDALRDRSERLHARIERLQRKQKEQ